MGEGNPRGNRDETLATPTMLGLQLDSRGLAAIIVFDPDLMRFSESPRSLHELPLGHGVVLDYFVLAEEQAFHHGSQSFGVRGY
jgi:hypothetical protein